MSTKHEGQAPISDTPLVYDSTSRIPHEKFRFIKRGEIKDEGFQTQAIGFFEDAMLRLRKNRASIASAWMITIIVALAILVPEVSRHGFNDQNIGRVNLPPRIPVIEKLGVTDGSRLLINRRESELSDKTKYPDGTIIRTQNPRTIQGVKMVDVLIDCYQLAGVKDEYHWFGTDYLGRDLMTRLFRGSRISLTIAFVSVASNVLIGVVYGSIAGYYGGSVDMVLMRFVEIMRSLPQLVMVTMFIMLFGTGMTSIILALVIRGWTPTASLIRAQFYRFKGREYVLAARTMGVPDYQLIFRHILPNCIGPVITQSMIAIPGAIFSESFLAFIGLGLQPPESSIGVLLSNGQKTLLQYPYQTLFPAVLISILMISFNLFANGLRDAFDPTKRGEE